MGVFANNAITDAGRILEGELKMGAVFTPTRIVMGSGFLPSGTTARTIKDVISPVISLQINKKNMSSNGTVIIGGVYSNAEIQSDFYFRELALYAKAVKSDGSATDEILYSYGNAGNAADLMPAYTSETAVEKQIDLVTYVGIDVKVDLTIESGIYVTQKQLEDALNGDEDIQQILNEHIGNKQNPHGVTAAQIGAYNKAETNNLINTHINNKQNPHGVTAAQVGAYTKSECITSSTALTLGLPSNATPNDAFLTLRKQQKKEIARITSSQEWTVPSNITNIDIYLVGGGGGGGASSPYEASGGGGGGYCKFKKDLQVTPGQKFFITIGAGGNGGNYENNYNGYTGGISKFGEILVANGGNGGIYGRDGNGSGGSGGSGGGGTNYGSNGGIAANGGFNGSDGYLGMNNGLGGGNQDYTPLNPYDGIMYGCGGGGGRDGRYSNAPGLGGGSKGIGGGGNAGENGSIGGGGGGAGFSGRDSGKSAGSGGSGICIIYG